MDLCAAKQNENEIFASFLQIWRSLYRRCKTIIPKTEQVDMFSENLIPNIKYPRQMQCLISFKQINEKALKCEKGLVEQGIIKYGTFTNNTNNDKSKFWSRNKNVTNDGVVDARTVNRSQLIESLQGPIQSSS